ncbi:MAG: sensor histidine kinase [Bacteroidales bacterium]
MAIKFKWFLPPFLGLAILAMIRLVGDTQTGMIFWQRSVYVNLSEIVWSIGAGYLLDFIAQMNIRYFKRRENETQTSFLWLEYLLWGCICAMFALLSVWLLHLYGNLPHYVADYVIGVIVTVLCSTAYYAGIRSIGIDEQLREHKLLLEKLRSEKLETELQLLKSQYHPHFLFNALNTIYFQIDADNPLPRRTIENLSDLLRYQLYTIAETVTLQQELNYIRSYTDLQKMRKEECLVLTIELEDTHPGLRLYPLLFQPFVENAFKYEGGEHRIEISLYFKGRDLYFKVINSLADEFVAANKHSGLGLENLRKRLELLYPGNYELILNPEKKQYTALLILKQIIDLPDHRKTKN